MNRDLSIGIAGLLIGLLGAGGTYYQILGERLVWIVFSIAGISLFVYFLWHLLQEVRTVVATFGGRWRMIDGRLRIGNTINVALRAETVQVLMESLQSSFDDDKQYQSTLRKTGKKVGENFATELRAELIQLGKEEIIKSGRTEDLIREKLNLWSEYDSSTGIGIFDVNSVLLDNDLLKGHIILKNCFLTFDRHSKESTCEFISGYLEGVILHLLDIDASVKETSCSSVTAKGECVFEIESESTNGSNKAINTDS